MNMSLLKWRYWTSCPKECCAPAMKLLKKMRESGNNLKILTIMKKIFIAAAAALTALVACQKNEVAAPAADSVLYATIEETDATKTCMDSNNNIRWSEGDQIWLHTTSGSVIGTLSSGSGTSSAEFSFGAYFGEMTGKAVYPYNEGHSVSGDVLSVAMPASYDLCSRRNRPRCIL